MEGNTDKKDLVKSSYQNTSIVGKTTPLSLPRAQHVYKHRHWYGRNDSNGLSINTLVSHNDQKRGEMMIFYIFTQGKNILTTQIETD